MRSWPCKSSAICGCKLGPTLITTSKKQPSRNHQEHPAAASEYVATGAPPQPFLIQTPFGSAYCNPADGSLWSAFILHAVIFPQSTKQQQPQILAAAMAPAHPAPAASVTKWRMQNIFLCQQQTLAVGTLQEDPKCKGAVFHCIPLLRASIGCSSCRELHQQHGLQVSH